MKDFEEIVEMLLDEQEYLLDIGGVPKAKKYEISDLKKSAEYKKPDPAYLANNNKTDP